MPHEPGSPAVLAVYSGPRDTHSVVSGSLTLQNRIFPKFLFIPVLRFGEGNFWGTQKIQRSEASSAGGEGLGRTAWGRLSFHCRCWNEGERLQEREFQIAKHKVAVRKKVGCVQIKPTNKQKETLESSVSAYHRKDRTKHADFFSWVEH